MNDIRITDLARPELNDIQKQAIVSAPEVSFTIDSVLTAATEKTGLSDFGAEDFKERLAVWLKCVEEDSGLSKLGRYLIYDWMVRSASNRLRVEDIVRQHPHILDIQIDRPLTIAGLPRSGTTHLVNSLATNPDLRAMTVWESMEPVPLQIEMSFDNAMSNPRFQRSAQDWDMLTTLIPYWHAMHDMSPSHIHEDCEIQCLDFSSYYLDWYVPAPTWDEYYFNHDQTPHYAYGKKVQQAMTWLKGPNRWATKSPHHMENLKPLHNVYPDATIIVTHRDPVAVIQSSVTLMAYFDRLRRTDIDMGALAEFWIGRIERMLRACVEDHDALPQNQVIDVYFHDYMANQRSTLEDIYTRANLEMTDTASRNIDRYLADNPRGKLGQVIFDLIGDFGVDVKALRDRFQFYYDRFPVKIEPVLGETR